MLLATWSTGTLLNQGYKVIRITHKQYTIVLLYSSNTHVRNYVRTYMYIHVQLIKLERCMVINNFRVIKPLSSKYTYESNHKVQ